MFVSLYAEIQGVVVRLSDIQKAKKKDTMIRNIAKQTKNPVSHARIFTNTVYRKHMRSFMYGKMNSENISFHNHTFIHTLYAKRRILIVILVNTFFSS